MGTFHPLKKSPWLAMALAAVCSGFVAHVAEAGQTVHVKILVDEEEPRRAEVWQQTLASRIDRASAILAQYCDLRFSATCFGTWRSENGNADFAASLKEFEKEVQPDPAVLAIGFSSQFTFGRGRTSLGGTRGPLNSHILIREGSGSIQESERLEVVVHELSHYLGAAHSGRSDSVMRPMLGDGRSRARAFRIALDPPNAAIVQLVASEVLDYRVQHVHQLSIPTKLRLKEQYVLLAHDNPRDQVAKKYASLMDKSIRTAIAQAQQRARAATTNPALRQNLGPNGSGRPR